MKKVINAEILSHQQTVENVFLQTEQIEKIAKICIECIKSSKKILIFGNGGSAADAQHIAAELVGRFNNDRIALPAIALTTDSSILTSVSNDFSFSEVFQRQIEALSSKGDTVIGISTSGNSLNVIKGLTMAKEIGCNTIGLTGNRAGAMEGLCDQIFEAPSDKTPRIQEMHILFGHILCKLIDDEFSK